MVHFFGPQSKNNTGMAALRAGLPVITVKAAVNTQSNAIIIIFMARECSTNKLTDNNKY